MIPESKHIAWVCHEANRAYCITLGDYSQPFWEDAPEWQRKSAISGVESHLAALSNGHELSPSASHEAWLAEKQLDGWKYGPVKDAEKKEHPCFLPYSELPLEQRTKDYIFASIVLAFFASDKCDKADSDPGKEVVVNVSIPELPSPEVASVESVAEQPSNQVPSANEPASDEAATAADPAAGAPEVAAKEPVPSGSD